MPRMSKKRKQEWALFLNERNRITYNGLCKVHRFTLLNEIMYNYKMFFFSRLICKKNTDYKISVLLSSFTYIS